MSVWTKLFTPPTDEPIVVPRFNFAPIPRTTDAAMLVEILSDDRIPAEVRLEYYGKFVAAINKSFGIIKFDDDRR